MHRLEEDTERVSGYRICWHLIFSADVISQGPLHLLCWRGATVPGREWISTRTSPLPARRPGPPTAR